MRSYKEETKKSYNENAQKLAEKFHNFFDLIRRNEFPRFMQSLQGKKILDLGCGAGDHALYFKNKGFDVTAIDISEEMIKLCKEKGIGAQVMDLEKLNFEKESFDGVWAVTSLLHVPKKNMYLVLDDIHAILKKDGVFHICVKEGEGEELVKDEKSNTNRFFAYYKKEELEELLQKKFQILDSRTVTPNNRKFIEILCRKKQS